MIGKMVHTIVLVLEKKNTRKEELRCIIEDEDKDKDVNYINYSDK
jgi:hypothetical protein